MKGVRFVGGIAARFELRFEDVASLADDRHSNRVVRIAFLECRQLAVFAIKIDSRQSPRPAAFDDQEFVLAEGARSVSEAVNPQQAARDN